MLRIVFAIFLFGCIDACIQRNTDNGIVCVCNSTNCDTVPKIEVLLDADIQIFYTSATEPGFNVKRTQFSNVNIKSESPAIVVSGLRHQKIIGFGGAFTDAAGQNILRLPEGAQEKLLESYFGPDGIGYSICRVPIGGTDFSPKPYSYDDVDNDTDLSSWKLQEEDLTFKIPMVQRAKELRRDNPLKLFATAWTAPPWMKTNPIWSRGFSMLKKENYQLWADYTLKFFDAYKQHNIEFWGLTTGNEPLNGFYSDNGVNSMGWLPDDQAKWIAENLGPTIRNSDHKDLKIMIHDESNIVMPFVVPTLLNNSKVLDVIDGIATHWYWDSSMSPEIKTLLTSDQKDLFLLSSEACYFQTAPLLGSWQRAAGYISSILDYLSYGFGGWIDWNMALNSTGGFTYINVLADSPIIISEDASEFYKQPLFYAMGHFSKFVLPDSARIEVAQDIPNIQTMAFLRPDNMRVVVVFNKDDKDADISLVDDDSGRHTGTITVTAKSINTLVYRNTV